MNSKKIDGVVFTPKWIADFMVEEIFFGKKITGDEKILENRFLVFSGKKEKNPSNFSRHF